MSAHRPSSPALEVAYKVLMRRNSIYIAFVLGGALLGERAVNKGFDILWENNNKGKLFKDLEPTLGGEKEEE